METNGGEHACARRHDVYSATFLLKCVTAPRPCALYDKVERSHTEENAQHISRRRTEAHRASSEERDGVDCQVFFNISHIYRP